MTQSMPTEANRTIRRRTRPPRPVAPPNAMAFRVNDACVHAGISRTTLYRLITNGQLKALNVAGRTVIEGDSLRALLRVDAVNGAQAKPNQPSDTP